ncbi:MAG: 23S rRNA (uracil(1939)-C(5))-methyltransferase RlmD [Bacteroidaceae bacterium]|nr:23S rRNA (uracil(1939)-C(5))-methyltransferase RlmD [Bacteroidaceae bacterium]
MSRNKKPLPLLEDIEITDFAAEGKAIARVNDMVIFVPWVVPGDICDLQITRKKHSFMEAKAVRIKSRSSERVEPRCPHFGVCGGCKWQCLSYDRQLYYKQQQVTDALTRIGKVQLPEALPIVGSAHVFGYRNKLEFSFSNKRWLTAEEIAQGGDYDNKCGVGFHISGAFDKVLDINCCLLMNDLQNRVRNGVRSYALERGLTFFDLRQQTGLLRDMIFRTAPTIGDNYETCGEVMLTMQFHIIDDEEQRQANELMEWISTQFPEITTIVWVNNLKCNDTIGDLDIHVYKGRGYVYELMEDLRFKVGPKSFYQTNNAQAYELYKLVRQFAGLTGKELVYDLYTGTGTIANFVARQARKVIGIEYVAEAIEDARVNAALNGIDNTEFLAGDMKDVLTTDFIESNGRPDVIITDPPRAGMHGDVVNTILHAAPRRIVYVSCNPATQARDLQLMDEQYKVVAYQPVDMFPHTQHVENVALLEKR